MEGTVEKHRFRFSVRFLMIVVALCALLLAPIVWEYRQNQRLVLAQPIAVREAERARVEAERARYLAQLRSAEAALNATRVGEDRRPVAGSPAGNPQGRLWAAVIPRGDARQRDHPARGSRRSHRGGRVGSRPGGCRCHRLRQ